MLYCTECGTPTGGDVQKFCTKCGAALAAAGPETGTALTTAMPAAGEPLAGTDGAAGPDPVATGSDQAAAGSDQAAAGPGPEDAGPEAGPPTTAMPSAGAPPWDADPPATAVPFGGGAAPEPTVATPDGETVKDPWSSPWSGDATGTLAEEPGFASWFRDAAPAPADETVQDAGLSPWSRDAAQSPSYNPPGASGSPATPSPWSRDATQSPSYPTGPQYQPEAPYSPAGQYGPGSPYGPEAPPYPLRPTGQPPEPPRSRSARWTAIVVIVVLLIAGGGFATWKFVLHKSPAQPSAGGSATPQNQTGGGSPAQGSATPTPPATPTPTPVPTSTPGAFPVAVSPSAAQNPNQQQVVSFLQNYFAAINAHSYRRYKALLDPVEWPSRSQFNAGFGTTTDSNATLTGIAPNGSGVAADLRFTSHQSPSDSPTGTGCNTWHITLFLEQNGSGYLIGPTASGYHARYQAC